MKYKKGQTVRIKESLGEACMNRVAGNMRPPYTATISHIEPDPHSGFDMYRFIGVPWGWYENEVVGLVEEVDVSNRFEILDL